MEGRSEETELLRARVKQHLEDDVEKFFSENRGQVAIYDANVCPKPRHLFSTSVILKVMKCSQNGTRVVRKAIRAKYEALGINVFFIGKSGLHLQFRLL